MKRLLILLTLQLFPCFLATIWASPGEDAWRAYLAGDFNKVALVAQEHLQDSTLSLNVRSQLSFTLGCAYAMQGRDKNAAEEFKRAFDLDPTMSHTSMELPPPVWKIYEPIQRQRINLDDQPVKSVNRVRTDTVRVVETVTYAYPKSTVIRSLLFPGWGHMSQGDSHGHRFMIIESLIITGLATSLYMTNNSRDEYSRATELSGINSTYNRYNFYYRLSWGLGATAAVVYLYAQWDLMTNLPPVRVGLNPEGKPLLGLQFTL